MAINNRFDVAFHVEPPPMAGIGILWHWARTQPDRIAIWSAAGAISYAELWDRAGVLANAMRDRGIRPGQVVAVLGDGSVGAMVATIGIWRSGGVYLPLSVHSPVDRHVGVLASCGAAAIVCPEGAAPEALERAVGGVTIDASAHRDAPSIDPLPLPDEERAYIITTSGSTGAPKAVLCGWGGLRNLIACQRELLPLRAEDRVLQYADCGFDASIFEMWLAFGAGGTLCLAPPAARRDGRGLASFVAGERVSVAVLTPSAAAALANRPLPDLQVLILAGDQCSGALAESLGIGRTLINAYGPTEATVCSTWHLCSRGEGPPPIGGPLPRVDAWLLDGELKPVRAGEVGELFIGGEALALGYLGRPDLTAERFIASPFDPGQRLYRTGDLARSIDGRLFFIGRADRQVKVRGCRIELGEVEFAMLQHPNIREAVVTVQVDDQYGAYLLAHVTPAAGQPGEEFEFGMRRFLEARLPSYMVPAIIRSVTALPQDGWGKIVRNHSRSA